MKIKNILILVFIFISLAGAYFVYFQFFKKTAVSTEKIDFSVYARDLFREFETNEQTATIKYNNKVVEVKGLISEIIKNQDNKSIILLKEEDAIFGINCSMDILDKNISGIRPGDSVSIIGILQGYLDDVILTNCKIKNSRK